MDTILLSHVYNESFLMPYFCKHYINQCDHAVIVDYASTDNTLDIVRSLCPKWEIRQSKNKEFDASECDEEINDIEQEFKDCWKFCFNTTEFLFHYNIRELLNEAYRLNNNVLGFKTHGINMVENPLHEEGGLDDRPLVLQRHYGYAEVGPLEIRSRSRTIHRSNDRVYEPSGGRHRGTINAQLFDPPIYLLWFGYSPWNRQMIDRKLQIQNRISGRDKIWKRGIEHICDERELNRRYREVFVPKSYNLLQVHPEYAKMHEEIRVRGGF